MGGKILLQSKGNIIIEPEEKDVLEKVDSPKTKSFDLFKLLKTQLQNQIRFEETTSWMGMIIIFTYLGIVFIAFLLKILGFCEICYPDFLRGFESLVLVIAGFFFGARLVTQYIPFRK